MTLKIAPMAIVLLSGLCSGADAQKPIVSIPLKLNKLYQYWIEARFNGSDPLSCGLDSAGGDRVYLDNDRAAKMGIKPTGTGRSAGPHDTQMKQDSRSEATLEVAGVKLVNQPVVLQSRPYADYSCTIGQTVFRQYIVEVDYEAAAIRLYDPEHFRYDGPGQVLPIRMEGGSPFVTATITTPKGKSVQAKVAVDTGGGSAIAMLSKPFVETNKLTSDIEGAAPEPQYGMEGQQARVLSARFGNFAVGRFEIPRPVLHFWQVQGFGGSAGPDGLLCGEFLRRFKVIFDYLNLKIILEPNAHFRD